MPLPAPGPPSASRSMLDHLSDYAVRFHSSLGADHVAASPLGAYLVLAAVAPAATGQVREELERTLGCTAEEAAGFLSALLASPHPAVATAIAIWNDPRVVTDALARWRQALPPGLEGGPIPTQAAANAWALQATRGMVEQFPIDIHPLTVLLLVSALATKGSWQEPFELVAAGKLGPSAWARRVRNVLHDGGLPGGQVIAWTEAAGWVGALLSRTTESLLVVSVIAAPAVEPPVVIAAAHEIAALVSGRASTAAYRSLFDLPLGEGHAWDIRETEFPTADPDERPEFAEVLIPAWRADSPAIDLLADARFGFDAAASALIESLPPNDDGYEARGAQLTTAKFDRYGFSAAS